MLILNVDTYRDILKRFSVRHPAIPWIVTLCIAFVTGTVAALPQLKEHLIFPEETPGIAESTSHSIGIAESNAANYESSSIHYQLMEPLLAKAIERGTVRVIVQLDTGFLRPGELPATSESALHHQRSIKEAQDILLNEMFAYGLKAVRRFEYIPYLTLEADAAALFRLAESPGVIGIAEDKFFPPALAESVPLIGGTRAWASGYSGLGQTIAILDTGVDKYHPFLEGKVVSEACYSTNDSANGIFSLCPGKVAESTRSGSGESCTVNWEYCGHGTHVAGIAAGKGTKFSGVARDANLIAVQVFSRIDDALLCNASGLREPCIMTATSDVLKGLERVQTLSNQYNIAAVNLSIGGGKYTSACDTQQTEAAIKSQIDNLRSLGIATIAAAGNDGFSNAMGSPACISTSISVGSTADGSEKTTVDAVSSFSNSASFLSLLAPGEWIYSSVPGGSFVSHRGTSMAAPHVAGAWAVLRSKAPRGSISDLLATLKSTGIPVVDTRNGKTFPRIQIDAALETLPAPDPAFVRAAPNPCFIQAGESTCTVFISITNPYETWVQVWLRDSSGQERQITATSADRTYQVEYSWIEQGKYTLLLYDVTGGSRKLLTTGAVEGILAPPAIKASPSVCDIPAGETVCSTNIEITNPAQLPVQLWVRDTGGIEKMVVGTITDAIYWVAVPWIPGGTTTFLLYDVSNELPQIIARTNVLGMGSPNLAVFPTSNSCTIPEGSTICSVTLQIFNPTRLPVQLWVFGLNGLERQVTGTITDTTYIVGIPWIGAGDYYFLLYDVTGGMIRLVATKKVTGSY